MNVVVEEGEVAAYVRQALGGVSQLKEVTVGLGDGTVTIGGAFQAGLAIPFESVWSAECLDSGRRVGVRLVSVSVRFFGLSSANLSAQVMAAVAQKFEGVPGVSLDGERILLDPQVLLASRGVRLEGAVRRIAVRPGRVEVEV